MYEYNAVYNMLYHKKPYSYNCTIPDTLFVGMTTKEVPKETIDLITSFGKLLIVCPSNCIPKDCNPLCNQKVEYLDDSECIKSLVKRSSRQQYRKLYAYNRMNKMVQLREYVRKHINNYYALQYSYIALCDLDLKFYKESIYSLFNDIPARSVVSSMGVIIKNYSNVTEVRKSESFNSFIYNDTIAYRGLNDDRYSSIHDNLNERLHSILGGVVHDVINSPEKLIQVQSAFGGMAIYPKDAFSTANYELVFNPKSDSNIECECEHVSFHYNLSKYGYKHFINKEAFVIYE